MPSINSPTDETVRQMQRDSRDLQTKINALLQRKPPPESASVQRVEVVKVASVLAGDENTKETTSQFVRFDDSAEAREVAEYSDGAQGPRNANALGGFAFPENDLVWQTRITGGTFAQMMRLEGQLFFGTTTSIVAQGGTGTIDRIAADGTPVSTAVDDYFGEQIGSGVLVVGCYSPDGKAYIIAAACEDVPSYEEASGSGSLTTNTFVLVTA